MAVNPMDPLSTLTGGQTTTEQVAELEKAGLWGNRYEESYESDGTGFVALVKLVFLGFVISGVFGVIQSLLNVEPGSDPVPPIPPTPPKSNYLALMLPADGLSAARNRKLQAKKTVVTIDNRSNHGYAVYRFRNQQDDSNPGPLVREATVNAATQLEIVCHVDQVFTIVRDDGSMFGYLVAEPEPGTLQVW
jgi:hypothetical protein